MGEAKRRAEAAAAGGEGDGEGQPMAVEEETTVDAASFPVEGRPVVAVDRDEFDLLPEYSATLPTQGDDGAGVKRWKAAIEGGWYLGQIVKGSLRPPMQILLTSPAEVVALIGAFRNEFVQALPESSREKLGSYMDRALSFVKATAFAVAQGRIAVMAELQAERDAHGQTLNEITDAEGVLSEHGLLGELYTKRTAREALPEHERPTYRVPPGIRRLLALALAAETAKPGALVDVVRRLLDGREIHAEEGCRCAEIQLADPTRHFRGCVLREKYPEPAGPVGQVITVSQELAGADPDRIVDVFREGLEQARAGARARNPGV